MNKNQTITLSAEAENPESTAPRLTQPEAPAPKRGFKPRWLRLQRRERKLKEARTLALRPAVG